MTSPNNISESPYLLRYDLMQYIRLKIRQILFCWFTDDSGTFQLLVEI